MLLGNGTNSDSNYPEKFSMRCKLFLLAPVCSWHAKKNTIYAWMVYCWIVNRGSSVVKYHNPKSEWFPKHTMHKKWSFSLGISSVNVTKSAENCGFGHINWRNPQWKISFFVLCKYREKSPNLGFFVHIFPYSVWIQENKETKYPFKKRLISLKVF